MKTLLYSLVLISLALGLGAAERRQIADPRTEKTETIEVKVQTRLWRIQVDADGAVQFLWQRLTVAGDTTVHQQAGETSRPITAAHADTITIGGREISLAQWLAMAETFARQWAAEDAAKASP